MASASPEVSAVEHTAVKIKPDASIQNLYFAIMSNKVEEAQENLKLIEENPKFINEDYLKQIMHKHPLLLACEIGNVGMVDLLWQKSENFWSTCLHAAVQSGLREMFDKITALAKESHLGDQLYKNMVFTTDQNQDYPIHVAARRGNFYAVKQMLESFSEVKFLKDKQGRNALHVSVESHHEKITCHLLKEPSWESLALATDNEGKSFLDKIRSLDDNALTKILRAIRKTKPNSRAQKKVGNKVKKIRDKERDRKRKEEISTSFQWLSVIAVLLATISYQGVLSMPGGGANNNSNGSGVLNNNTNNTTVSELVDDSHFKAFVRLNTVALTVSLMVVLFLTKDMLMGFLNMDRYLSGHLLRMRYFNLIISVGSICILLSYGQGLKTLYPRDNPVSSMFELYAFIPLFCYLLLNVATNSTSYHAWLCNVVKVHVHARNLLQCFRTNQNNRQASQ